MGPNAGLFYEAIRDDLLALIGAANLSDDFADAIRMALRSDGRVLSSNPRSRWPLLLLLPGWAAGGNWRDAVPAASAAEMAGAATDLFDELEDGDSSPLVAALGAPRAMNLASALLALAGQSVSRVAAPAGGALPSFFAGLVAAADGQHRDLGALQPATSGEYLALVDRKSAGLTSALCSLGARLAGLPPDAVAGYAAFGLHLGRWAQLLNDLHDLWPGNSGKSDLQRRLVTLPIVFARRGESELADILRRHLSRSGPLPPRQEQALREALWASGALHYTWLVAEANRSAAEAILREICPPLAASTLIELLLPPVPSVESLMAAP